jgi:hypothetical protein
MDVGTASSDETMRRLLRERFWMEAVGMRKPYADVEPNNAATAMRGSRKCVVSIIKSLMEDMK